MDFDLDVEFDMFDENEDKELKEENIETGDHVISHKMGHRQLTRKVTSEKALEDNMDWHFHENDCYHCFSFGDVDSFTYFKHVLRQEKNKLCIIINMVYGRRRCTRARKMV